MTNFSRILEAYGERAVIENNRKTKVFIQPAVKNGNFKNTHLGIVNVGDYYVFAPADSKLAAGNCLKTEDAEYDVVRAEKLKIKGDVSHIEGILRRRENTYVD